ncbi:MAG TPA: DUF6117 family protein [Gemmatales bacterium]|nr:DUF6117 family protein [Gemmatales bacterium]
MIPKPYRDNFNTLSRAFGDGAACLVECRERTTGRPAYVVCAVGRRGQDYELVPFARLFDDNPYELLAPPGEMAEPSTSI